MTHLTTLAREDDVALLTLTRGAKNALSLDLVAGLSADLQTVAADPAFRSFVITSKSERFLSIGFDLPELLSMGEEEFTGYLRAFNRLCVNLYTLPMPTVAAIRGHAVAGGCILALCCDYRHIASGRKLVGLNEIKLGVPIPRPATCILRSLVGTRVARDVVESGEFFEPEDARRMGLVDRILPPDDVLPESLGRAAALGDMPSAAFRAIKRARTEPVLDRIRKRLEESEREFLECWFSDDTRRRLAEAAEKF